MVLYDSDRAIDVVSKDYLSANGATGNISGTINIANTSSTQTLKTFIVDSKSGKLYGIFDVLGYAFDNSNVLNTEIDTNSDEIETIINYDYLDAAMCLSGYIPGASKGDVTILATINRGEDYCEYIQNALYYDCVACDSAGTFAILIPLGADLDKTEIYVYILNNGLTGIKKTVVNSTYLGKSILINVLSKISNFNTTLYSGNSDIIAAVAGIFDDAIFKFDKTEYNKLSENGKATVLRTVLGKSYAAKEYINAFYQVVAQIAENEAEEARLEAIRTCINGSNEATLENNLKEYADSIDINLKLVYDTLGDGKTIVISKLEKAMPFITIEDIKSSFDSLCAVTAVNNAKWTTMESVLKINNFVLKIDLADTIPINVLKGLALKSNYETIAEIKEEYAAQVSKLSAATGDEVYKSVISGSSGVGHTSSTGVVTYPVVPEKTSVSEDQNGKNSLPFNDFNGYEWAKEAVSQLYDKGIIKGKAENTFDPSGDVTREEFVKMLILTLGINENDNECKFTDANQGEWYYKYISNAFNKGIIKGYADGRFGVGEPISRQDVAAIIYRGLEVSGLEIKEGSVKTFDDEYEISDYAYSAVKYLNSLGIINGMEDNVFAPQVKCTRAEAANMLFKVLNAKAETK